MKRNVAAPEQKIFTTHFEMSFHRKRDYRSFCRMHKIRSTTLPFSYIAVLSFSALRKYQNRFAVTKKCKMILKRELVIIFSHICRICPPEFKPKPTVNIFT